MSIVGVTRDQPKFSEWLSANLVWLATLTLFILVLVKIIRVSDSNLPTAYALLSTTGPLTVTLAALIDSFYLVLMGITLGSLQFFTHVLSVIGRITALSVALLALLMSAFVAAWYITIVLMVFVTLSVVLRAKMGAEARQRAAANPSEELANFRKARQDFQAEVERFDSSLSLPDQGSPEDQSPVEDRRAIAEERLATAKKLVATAESHRDHATRRVRELDEGIIAIQRELRGYFQAIFLFITALFVVPLMLNSLLSSRMWLAPERIRLSDGSSILGYMLNADGDWHSVLVDSPRSVIHVRVDKIQDRTVCRLDEGEGLPSLASYLAGKASRPPYPECIDTS